MKKRVKDSSHISLAYVEVLFFIIDELASLPINHFYENRNLNKARRIIPLILIHNSNYLI